MAEAEPLIRLSDALLTAESLPRQMGLFLPADRQWTADTLGALLDTDDEDDPDNPQFARSRGLVSALGVSEVQEVVSNAREQDSGADVGKLLQAFLFYFRNDAFIDFGGG